MQTASSRVTRDATSNTYCVPAALSALTGLHVDKVIELVREHLGDQPISGLYYPIALRILRDLGYKTTELPVWAPNISLQGEIKHLSSNKDYLVTIHGHMLVVSHRHVIDNAYPNGIMPEKYPMRHARVEKVWLVSATRED